MISFDVKSDLEKVITRMNAIHDRKQVRFATAVALTRTVKKIADEQRRSLPVVFNQPVPLTLKSIFFYPATKEKLQAIVKIRDEASRGTAPIKYLFAEIYGGERRAKRYEVALRRAGILPITHFTAPGRDAMDRSGNIKGSLVTKVLSNLRIDSSGTQNLSRRAKGERDRGGHARKEQEFFVVPINRGRAQSRLPPGIYRRLARRIRLIILFIRKPHYAKRFRFYEIADEVIKRDLLREFEASLKYALETAR